MPTFLIFNAAEAIQQADLLKGDLRMRVAVPTLPAANQARKFGLATAGLGSGIYFEVTGTTFRAVVKDNNNGGSSTTAITFENSWVGRPIEYRIIWEPERAIFYIEGARKCVISFPSDVILSNTPLSTYIYNGSSDNMLVGTITGTGFQSYLPLAA